MDYISLLKNKQNEVITLDIEKNIYSKSTLLKTCYKFTDSLYIFINSNIKDETIYTIYFQVKNKKSNIQDLLNKFNNELLDQELRSIVLSETRKVRDTIVTRALISGQPNDN